MRTVVLVLALAVFAACLPQGPTGHAIAPPTHFEDGSQVLVKSVVSDPVMGVHTVRIDVLGDRVYPTVLVNGNEMRLSGKSISGDWIEGVGSVVVFLEEGEHTVHAFSCLEDTFGWKCGCRSRSDCGHWMERTVVVR